MADSRHDGSGDGQGTVQDCDGAFEVLRVVLLDVVDGKSDSAELRAPVRQLCVFAHSEDVSAERLLIRFKELWATLPPLAGLPRGRQRNELMAQVATMCIEEFYGPPDGNGSTAASAAVPRQAGESPPRT